MFVFVKRFILLFISVFVFLIYQTSLTYAYPVTWIWGNVIYADNKEILLDTSMLRMGDDIFIPLSGISKVYGFSIEYSSDAEEILIKNSKNDVLIMSLGSLDYSFNGVKGKLKTAPVIKNYLEMVPLLFITEVFGKNAIVNYRNRSVNVYAEVVSPASYYFNGYAKSNVGNIKSQSGFKAKIYGYSDFAFTDGTNDKGYFKAISIPKVVRLPLTLELSRLGYFTSRYEINEIKDVSINTELQPITMFAGDVPINGTQDGVIDSNDIEEVLRHYNSFYGCEGYNEIFDFNRDNAINMEDIMVILMSFNKAEYNIN